MSMDEVEHELLLFIETKKLFDEHLRSSVQDLEKMYEEASPYWQDETRQQHDAKMNPFKEWLKRYIENDGLQFTMFLINKAIALGRYLRGNS